MGTFVCLLLDMKQQGLNCEINVIITFENGASRHIDLSWQVKERHHRPHNCYRAQPCKQRKVDVTQIRKYKNWIPRNVNDTYSR